MNKYIPTREQDEFIKNTNKFLIVSAGPGSGKTATIVEYLKNIIEDGQRKQIIVSSFTKNSTNEIKNRFFQKYNDQNKKIFFQTFDSFLITKIWKFYFNRILEFATKKININFDDYFGYLQKEIVYSKISWRDFKKNYKNNVWIEGKIKEFVNYGKEGKLLVGFVSEYILINFLKSNKNIKKYLSTNFKKVIIDEAQDLSILRYEILLYFHEHCEIEITLVGDERQTIYEYLGAERDIFKILKRNYNGIKQIYLNKNFRYSIPKETNSNILSLIESNDEEKFRDEMISSIKNNKIEILAYDEIIKKIGENNNLFLTKTNKEVEEISENLIKQGINNRAVLSIPSEFRITHEAQGFIENIFIYNQIKLGKIKYSFIYSDLVNEICDFIWPFNPNKNKLFLKLFWNDKLKFPDLINKVAKLTRINNLNEVIELFENNNNYLKNISTHKNQVMTYHGAKGLEGYNIFINGSNINSFLDRDYNSPTYNEMYVAISRVKNKIFFIKNQND